MMKYKLIPLAVTLAFFSASMAQACTPRYEIAKGDTLWKIASKQLGTVWASAQIYEDNRDVIGSNPDLIYAGDVLDIACEPAALGDIDWSVMPTADVLETIIERVDIQVVDVRSIAEIGSGFIPGSVWLPYSQWRGPADNPGAPREAAYYAEMIGKAGVRTDVPTIIVHAENTPMSTGSSAYVYWIMKSLGAEQLAILRGGFDAWSEGDHPIEFKSGRLTPYKANLSFSEEWRAPEQQVYDISLGDTDGVLLDARPHHMFNRISELGEAIASTIPGARNLPAGTLMQSLAGEFVIEDGVDTVISHYRETNALGSGKDIIVFCHSGQLSALNWFYASELASIDDVKLYPESITGWTQSFGVLATGEAS